MSKKKILLLIVLLATVITAGVFAIFSNADTKVLDSLTANIQKRNAGSDIAYSGTVAEQFNWQLTEDGTLTISPVDGANTIVVNVGEGTGTAANWSNIPWIITRDSGNQPISKSVKSVNFTATVNAVDMRYFFNGCSNMESVDLSKLNTTNLTNTAYLFNGCSSLTSINLSRFNTSNVTTMERMFNGCSGLTAIDVSSFDTRNVTNMDSMFNRCSSLTELNLSNFVTPNLQNLHYFYTNCPNLLRVDLSNLDTRNATNMQSSITLNKKGTLILGNNVKINTDNDGQEVGAGSICRGTVKRVHNGQTTYLSGVEVCRLSKNGNAAGTYTRVNDGSNEIYLGENYNVTYKISPFMEPAEYSTSADAANVFVEDIREIDDIREQAIFAKIPKADVTTGTGNVTLPGELYFKFKNAVTNANGQKFDLKMTIKNIKITNLYNQDSDKTIMDGLDGYLYKEVVYNNRVINFSSRLYNSIPGDTEASIAYLPVSQNEDIYDVILEIQNSDGTPVEGTYLFSAYDLDIGSIADVNVPGIAKTTDGRGGYGEHSEGINLGNGMDTANGIAYSNPTFLRNLGENHIRGSRDDGNSELSEFVVKANATRSEFQWTGPENAVSQILSFYQPLTVEIRKNDGDSNRLAGAVLELYHGEINAENKVGEWTSSATETWKLFLNPGQYSLHEKTVPTGYNKADDIVFFINSNSVTRLDGEDVTGNTIVMVDQNKIGTVYVHHYIEGTTTKVPLRTGGTADDETHTGQVGTTCTTNPADVPDYYELVATPANANPTFAEEDITVTYYYRLKKYPYTVKYVDKDTNLEIATKKDVSNIPYGTEISAEDEKNAKGEITNYTYDSADKNTLTIGTGTNQIILYYTKKKAPVITRYVDMNKDPEAADESKDIATKKEAEYPIGSEYTTVKEEIPGYTFVKDSRNTTGTVETEDPINVIYYYKKNAKVIVNHIDKITGELIKVGDVDQTETKNGLVGDDYTTASKSFEGYVLVTDELPTNASGIEKHIDDITGDILYNEHHTGNEGDDYDIKSKPQDNDADEIKETFKDYDLVEEKLPTNAIGKMTKDDEPIEVIYYYKHKAKVIIKHIDDVTGEEIPEAAEDPIEGHEGDEYSTDPKEIEGYDLIIEKLPENADGTMTKDDIEVIYYYKRPAKVIINYLEDESNKVLAEQDIISGHQGDEYDTEVIEAEKEKTDALKYYLLIKEKYPENSKGNMTVTVDGDEVNDTIVVNYYYRKKIFNLKTEKNVTSVVVNGVENGVSNGKLGKAEVNRKKVNSTSLRLVYTIKITNDGEIEGSGTIVENIPGGMTMKAENNAGWIIKGDVARIDTGVIAVGESKEFRVILDWDNSQDNFGTKRNLVELESTKNDAGFEESNLKDNDDSADAIISVSTGVKNALKVLSFVFIGLIVLALIVFKATGIKVRFDFKR